ncbi:MAG: HIT domain-containing protein [Rhizobiaceae bacterium]
MTITLDARLGSDTLPIAQLTLCELRLMDDARWPWLILVPQIESAIEWHELFSDQRQDIDFDIANVAAVLKAYTECEKVNIASLGNAVRQLHIHVVARGEGDPNWPAPVWGFGKRVPYSHDMAEGIIQNIQNLLDLGIS